MIFAPRQPRHLRSGRRVTLQRIDSNNFTRNWLRSYKNTSSPPPCTTLPNSAQSCPVRLRRKHSAFSRELGPLRPASSVPGVVSEFIGVHRRPIWFSLNRQILFHRNEDDGPPMFVDVGEGGVGGAEIDADFHEVVLLCLKIFAGRKDFRFAMAGGESRNRRSSAFIDR